MHLPQKQIINKLIKHNTPLFFVGGLVRDLLLGREISDIDIVVEGSAIEFCKKIEGEILSTHPDFDTVKMKIDGVEIDFASTREETYPKSGCLPLVKNVGCALKNDVKRRDFTLNAIAINLKTGEIIDYLNGRKDLENKELKLTYGTSFVDDPTRILRALDFHLRFDFKLPEAKIAEFLNNLPPKDGLSLSRVDLTLKKILKNPLAYKKIIEMNLYKIFQEKAPKISPEKLEEAIVFYGAEPIRTRFLALKNEIPNCSFAQNSNYEIYMAYKGFSPCELALLDNFNTRKFYSELKDIKLSIGGDDLIENGVVKGKIIGDLLEATLREKLNNASLNTKEDELNFALSIYCAL